MEEGGLQWPRARLARANTCSAGTP
jgi:hypothetical protein